MNLPHLPALRRGVPYRSLDTNEVLNHRTGQAMAVVSQVNAGILRKDLARVGQAREALRKFSTAELIAISAKAGELFLEGTLPLGDGGHMQSADDYVRTLSRWGFEITPYLHFANGLDGLLSEVSRLTESRPAFPFDIDGLVVKLDRIALWSLL